MIVDCLDAEMEVLQPLPTSRLTHIMAADCKGMGGHGVRQGKVGPALFIVLATRKLLVQN